MSARTELIEEAPNWRRRIAFAILAGVGLVLVYTLLYQWAMARYAEPVSFLHALRIVVESLTTAGFGGDTLHWQTGPLHVLVIAMNLSGVLLVFLALPLFVVPLFRQVFQTRPPTTSTLEDHVIICGFSPQDEVLRAELEAVDVPYLYVDSDPDLVTDLNEGGVNAIVGNPERIDVLESANASAARALVADIDDEINPTVILSAKQVNPDLYTISVIRKPEVEPYHEYAKADEIVSNRRVLGKSLGLRAAGSYAEKLRETIGDDSDLQVTEMRIKKGSDLVGRSLRETIAFDEMGVTVIGAWVGGKFLVTPDPDTVIEENSILLVVGGYTDPDHIQAQHILTRHDGAPKVIVCGYGTVGRAIVETLQGEHIDVEVIDIEPKEGVDILGDIADPGTFEEADLEHARAVVLSIDEDVKTIYATLILNEIAEDAEIIVRADDADSVQKLYNAGADFVLSLPAVTGEILAASLIEQVDILTPDIEIEFFRADTRRLAGRTLKELDVRRNTGSTVVAVERGDRVITTPGADYEVTERDTFILAGSAESHERFDQWLDEFAESD